MNRELCCFWEPKISTWTINLYSNLPKNLCWATFNCLIKDGPIWQGPPPHLTHRKAFTWSSGVQTQNSCSSFSFEGFNDLCWAEKCQYTIRLPDQKSKKWKLFLIKGRAYLLHLAVQCLLFCTVFLCYVAIYLKEKNIWISIKPLIVVLILAPCAQKSEAAQNSKKCNS